MNFPTHLRKKAALSSLLFLNDKYTGNFEMKIEKMGVTSLLWSIENHKIIN